MYRLLIVDDEQSIRNGIIKGNPWNEWGFEIVGDAADGFEALRIIEQTAPDVILSDIRMPNMDGIELMQYVNKNYPQIKMVILSGYSDFEYLNMSIKHHVTEYLLKPTDIDEFEELFKRIKQELDKESTEREAIEKFRISHLDATLNTMIKGYDEFLMSDDVKSLNSFSIYPDNCVIVMVDAEAPGSGHDAGDLFAMRRTVIEFANSVSHPDISAHYFLNSVDEITGILSGDKTSDKNYVREYFSALAAQIKYYCNIKICVSVSLKCDNVLMLPQCFEQALNLAHRKVFENDEITAFYRVQKKTDSRFPDFIFDYDAIWQNIIKGNTDAVFAEVDRVFSLFESDSSVDYKNIEQICIDFLFFLSRRSMKFNISFEQIMEENGIHYEDIRNTVNLVRRKAVITDCLKALIDCISQSMTHSSKSSSLAQVIKDFCDKEYMENYISLEYIAGKVNKSVAYISKIFKDEFGVNFSEYIISKRLEKSREYLLDNSLKIYEIADKIGYVDVSNYIKLFKKRYGISPGDYRNFIQSQ